MTPELIGMMLMAVLGAVVLYTFIGFIPGTDETSVLAPITLAVVLSGAPPEVVLAFFVSAVVTLNLMNGIPTALVGLPGGVMSAPLMEHSVFLRNRGLASETIRKMAVGSAIGTVVSIPLSFILAGLLAPIADPIKAQTPVILAAGTVLLALLGTNRILALVSVVPMALMFEALPALYRTTHIITDDKKVSISFFLGITVGPMLVTLLELLNPGRRAALPHGGRTRTALLRSGFESHRLMPGRLITRSEGRWSALMAAVSTPLFVLSPVGLTFLLGEASVARQKKDPVRRAQRAVTVMSSLTHSTYLAGVIIPLVALGIPVSGVSAGPAGPLFNAPPVYDLGNNLHHRLQLPGFIAAVVVGALISVVITYVIAVRWSSQITYFVMRRIPHEAVLTLFVVFILLLAYIDAGVPNMFGVLLVGVVCGALNRLGVSYGVQFMTLYAAPGIISMIKMPARPAPDEMPMMCGSASGLRRMACRIAPESARLMPTSAATIVRGKRMFQRICACAVSRAPPRMFRISLTGMSTEPLAAERIIAKTASTAKSASSAILFFMDRSASPCTSQLRGTGCRG